MALEDSKRQLHIVLHQPEIPHNTGSVIRLSANIGASLHLIRPLGFELDDKRMLRAGLDYHEFADISVHDSLINCRQKLVNTYFYAFTTKTSNHYHRVNYFDNCALVFGSETRGLGETILQTFAEDKKCRLPMLTHNRSLNLANTVSIASYEVLRQQGFSGDFK